MLLKLATVMALLVALLIICMLVKAIADQQKQYAALVRKNETLRLELNTQEDVKSLEADFEAVLKNDN